VHELEADLKEEFAHLEVKEAELAEMEAGICWREVELSNMAGQSTRPQDVATFWDQLRWHMEGLEKIQEDVFLRPPYWLTC
jgi:hypothetical protein